MVPTEKKEYEAKYLARPCDSERILGYGGEILGFSREGVIEKKIRDTYFDTPKLELFSLSALYRCRWDGDTVLGAFKAESDDGRDGIIFNCDEDEEVIPSEHVGAFLRHGYDSSPHRSVQSFIERNGLDPRLQVFLHFENYHRKQALYVNGHTRIELSIDSLEFRRKNKRAQGFFVESEFKGGDYMRFKEFCTYLRDGFNLKPCPDNKVKVGLARLLGR